MSETPDPHLVLKVTPPRLPRTTQFRERLSFDNIEYRDCSIVEINAPAGFGKTTLLGQWRRESFNRGTLVAWLTLDENDHRLRFAQGLAYTMRQASGRPGFDRINALLAHPESGALEGLTAWLAEVTFLGAEVRLILDEVQSAPANTIEESLLYLLLNAPPNLRIVLASRRKLELPIADLVARGLYTVIGAEQIRLTQAETNSILSARFGGQIAPDDCVRLHEKVGGWPLGLQLALASIEKKPNLSASIDALAAVTRNFESYFLEKFVAGLAPTTVAFLEEISILDALRPDLCAALSGRDDAVGQLDALRQTLPIFIESGADDWVRLHPMALDYLRSQLAKRDVELPPRLHERAAHWFEQQAMFEEAAQHQMAAGNSRQAYDLIGDRLHDMMTSGHQSRVLDWLERMPPAELEERPRILLAAAWALAESERHADGERLVRKLQDDPAASELDRFEGVLVGATASYFGDEPDRAAAILAPWDHAPADAPPLFHAVFANAKSTMRLYAGKPEQARQIIRLAHANWPERMDAVRGWGEWVTGFSYLWEGKVELAVQALLDATQRCEATLGRRSALSVMFASTLSEALADAGKIDEAALVLADRLDVIDRLAAPQSIAMGYRSAARIALAAGQERRAIDLLEYLHALGERRAIPRFCVTSLAEQVRLHALRGRGETAASAGKRLDAIVAGWDDDANGMLRPLLALRAAIARAFARLAIRDWAGVRAALAPARATAERLQRGRERIEIMQLDALATHHHGGDGAALLGEARSLATLYGFNATLFDSQPDLFAWSRRGSGGLPAPEAQRPAPAPERPKPLPVRAVARGGGLLTVKEEEILLLLAKNLPNKHVAAALGISGDTVKWHIRNLFGKLNAGSRKHAVDRARLLGILPDVS